MVTNKRLKVQSVGAVPMPRGAPIASFVVEVLENGDATVPGLGLN